MKIWILCVTLAILPLCLSAEVLHIPDTNLERVLREELHVPAETPITEADMRQLTSLNAAARQITDLTGLEHATNLTELRLGGNPITDIRPLTHLTQLTFLRLNECWTIADISPLAHLTQLNRLHLDRNLIVDISPLVGLTKLESLDLRDNRIIDVSPLENLTQLTRLRLSNNQIIDITPLANLTNLVALWLSDNRITDVTALENLTQLTVLRLSNNQIKDVSPLENLTNLEQLDTDNNPIFDPDSPLVEVLDPNLRAAVREALKLPDDVPLTQENMNRLIGLDVRNQGIANLTGLEFATNLHFLRIADNPTIDLNPIANLTQLESLILWLIPQLNIAPLANLTNLRNLTIAGCDIDDISPLGTLTRLTNLYAGNNQIINVTPLARLTNLVALDLRRNNRITDVTVLANLTQLTELNLSHNKIEDVSPLANLAQLAFLSLRENRIVDVSPLANLSKLETLDIRHNLIPDYTTLDRLALTEFLYDEICEHAPFPVRDRIENRNYPSIFARWSGPSWPPIVNRPELTGIENQASHDLWFSTPMFGLRFEYWPEEIRVVGDLDEAIRRREEFLAINPSMVFLVQVRMRSGGNPNYLPEDSPYWIRDAEGNRLTEQLIDFTHPFIQDRIVQQAISVSKCGLYDGIMFDWWVETEPVLADRFGDWSHKFRGNEAEQRARDNVLRRIRAATRPDFLILGNSGGYAPRTGPYLNGGFWERPVPRILSGIDHEEILAAVEKGLLWNEQNLREPRIIALEGEAVRTEPPDSPTNLRWMRAVTTLSLTHSDGYVLFTGTGIPKDYRHYWFDFWDADLGRPLSEEKAQLYDEQIPGLYIREYTNGWAVYNHSGSEQQITLPELAVGVASRLEGNTHTLSDIDGEMYLRVKPANPADVNGDGVVNILDLVVVAQAISTGVGEGDVNGDGIVNVFDLVFVAGAIGGGGAAPSAYSPELSNISATDVAKWLADAQGLGVGDANFQRGIRFLESLLAALTPKETTLLPNYPNPFNPETWIPYRLAQEAEVAITIYDTKGTPVRRLALGNQAAGYYAERGRAAYWDGRNEDGEAVASGIYIYQFLAGDYAASRRMVIVK